VYSGGVIGTLRGLEWQTTFFVAGYKFWTRMEEVYASILLEMLVGSYPMYPVDCFVSVAAPF
jgi:hypothetical protein